MNDIFAIIVTFNPTIDILINQFKSVISQIKNIIYVDNGSIMTPELVSFFHDITLQYEKVIVIYNIQNKGLGNAQNQGINKSRELGATAVVILDHDSVIRPLFIQNLYNSYLQLSDLGINIGAVGPTYINESTGEIYPITKYIGPFIKRIIPCDQPVEASFLISSGCFAKIEIFDKVGEMNEDLFIDYIDIEWSYRVRHLGYKLYAVPTAVMNHTVGDKRMSVFGRKISVHSPIRRYYLTRNSFHMLRCPYVSLGYKIREITFNIFRIIIFCSVSDNRAMYLKYSFFGIIDGIRGIKGEFNHKQK
jgi:rhamnosyltransferase